MASKMNGEIVGSIDMTNDAIISYSERVDSMIRSETASYLGESRLPSFASRVDRAIRSRTPSKMSSFGTSLHHTFPRLFTLRELEEATDNFSFQKMIGAGSKSVVYRGKLFDGRELAVRRGGAWSKIKIPFSTESAILSRLPHHKHLVGVVGLCEEKDERLLVYEYMNNGSLYDHLHLIYSRVLNSWKMRIKIALDVFRGIQYLLNNTVPYVDRHIKSSNILLDATWTAKVSDFRMTFMKNTTGWDGCIDPEYDGMNALAEKRDIHAFGVLLLELLTGKAPEFKSLERGTLLLRMLGNPETFAFLAEIMMKILAKDSIEKSRLVRELVEDLMENLDSKVGPPDVNEAEAVALVAETAIRCVALGGKNKPTMADIVVHLEHAFAICESR